MKIKTGMLAFEVTRRCNETCLHCCKGKAESIDITKEVIDKVLKSPNYKIKEMKYLAIAGGEPTLVPDIVVYLIDTIIEEDISITSNINFITNGLIYSDKIINALEKLMKCLKTKENCKDTRLVFEISNDQFHKRPSKEVLDKYRKLPYIDKSFLEQREIPIERLLNDGNAKENNLGATRTYKNYLSPIDIKLKDDTLTIKNELIITSNGNVTSTVGGPYKDEDENSWGNLKAKDFSKIIIDKMKSIV